MDPNFYLIDVFSETEPPVLYLDFDGTISKTDVIDAVLKEFADKRWLDIEQEWLDGTVGSRECLRRQIDLVRATRQELDEFYATVRTDVGLPAVLRFCSESGIAVHVVSDGFDNYISRILAREIPSAAWQTCISGQTRWFRQATRPGKPGSRFLRTFAKTAVRLANRR